MDFMHIFEQMLVLCVPIAVGWVARKLGFMNDKLDGDLSRLVLYVTLPCLLISSVSSQGGELPAASTALLIVGLGIVSYLIAIAIAYLAPVLMRAPRTEAGAYRFIITFGNVGFIGYPVLTAIYGQQAVLYAAIANIPANLFMYSLGIAMIRKAALDPASQNKPQLKWTEKVRRLLKDVSNPTFIASLVLLALVLLRINNLGFLGDGLAVVGNFTTPAALLVIGSSLAQYDPRLIFVNWRAYVTAACRLLVVPLVLLVVLGRLVPDDLVRGILIVGCAMPAASNGTLFSLLYGADIKPMMQGTVVSIIASVFTIPLVTLLV